jgi:two-component system, OmpR family, sensor kinase
VSLRGRLLAGMIVLVTVGLAVAAVATYAEQRSFLYNRLDEQVRSGLFPIAQGLHVAADGREPFTRPGFNRGAAGRPGFVLRPPKGRADQFPAGTVGELVGPRHRVIRQASIAFGGVKVKAPRLPAHFPISKVTDPSHLFTFSSAGTRYRAVAVSVTAGTVVVAVPLKEVDQTLHRLVVVEALVGAGVIIALFVLGWFVIAVGLRPLERIGQTATEIAHGDLSHRVSPATSRTEVGRLGLSLNDMLVQIEQAFADRSEGENRLRQFLADASHELRTPLAAVRAYAELYRIGAATDPEAVERSMARIEAEATRMGGLVEDLLALARLDQLPEAERRPVELSELAQHAADDARAMAPGHELRFHADGPHWVIADSDQLRQVLANLLRNAVIHTPAGTLIELNVSATGRRVRVEVRDHGPGLPAGIGEQVFERFWRSEGGRTRGRGGAGLGLAIVRAIVTAHHGEVHAANAPGGGASFRVTLPAADGPSGNTQVLPNLSIDDSATVGS